MPQSDIQFHRVGKREFGSTNVNGRWEVFEEFADENDAWNEYVATGTAPNKSAGDLAITNAILAAVGVAPLKGGRLPPKRVVAVKASGEPARKKSARKPPRNKSSRKTASKSAPRSTGALTVVRVGDRYEIRSGSTVVGWAATKAKADAIKKKKKSR